MDIKRTAGIVMLGLATVAAIGLARQSHALHWTDDDARKAPEAAEPEQRLTPEEVRQTLQTYFAAHYSEAAASSVFADLTHDGQEELLVLEMGEDRMGEPIQLHSGDLDPDRFTQARVTVLRAGADEDVWPIYEFDCGSNHIGWGELYLKTWEGKPHLLWYAPYTSTGRSDFQLALFALEQDGTRRDVLRQQVTFSVAGGSSREGDADQDAVGAFLAQAEELLANAKPVIVYNAIHDPISGTDGERRFAYLDELFTTY